MENKDSDYMRDLAETLRSRDPERLRGFLRRSAEERDPDKVSEIESISDQDLEARMHKMIIARPELTDLHVESRNWLSEHGYTVSF